MSMDEKGVLESFRILAIDPGSSTMGVAILDISPSDFKPTVMHVTTVNVQALLTHYETTALMHGERIARLIAVEKTMYKLLSVWEPELVVSESPYMGRFPQAYAVLVDCLSAIRRALNSYDPTQMLHTIDPASIKKAVGVSGKSGDKEAMKRAVCALSDLNVDPDVDLTAIDEHSNDAIAAGYAQYKLLFTKQR
jgi:Holliday junction resolvasome RuvABC endonuclease subunit